MATAVDEQVSSPALAPISATLRRVFGTDSLPGLAPGLLADELADEQPGWLPASALVNGRRLPELLDAATELWPAKPSTVATLAWKAYSYWLALPAVLGWAAVRRVPLLHPADVLVRLDRRGPLATIGLRRSVQTAVLPTDPLAVTGTPSVQVVADEAELLGLFRRTLLDEHLTPLLAAICARVRVATRNLLGSVASGTAHALLLADSALPSPALPQLNTLLTTFGVADLIDLVPDADGRPTVRRRTCCQAFTLPRPKICTDCCLRTG